MQRIAKIIACILILSCLMKSSMAAPFADKQASLESSHENKLNRKNGFTIADAEKWRNPCNAETIMDSNFSESDQKQRYDENYDLYLQMELNINETLFKLSSNEEIISSNYSDWKKFHHKNYEFLPKLPTGNHRRWHYDLQKYVAAFIILEKTQKKHDAQTSNNTLSKELFEILSSAKALLCEIEHFVNATSKVKISDIDWIKRGEMRKLIEFQNLTSNMAVHRTYTKGLFQEYVNLLFRRVKQQSKRGYVETKVEHVKKSLQKNKQKTTKKSRRGNRRGPKGQKNDQQYEISSTKRVHIVRTSKSPSHPRNNKNKMNKNRNERRQNKTSTTVASV